MPRAAYAETLASPTIRNLVIDHTAAHSPAYADEVRRILYPARLPRPLNLELCSSCEVGSHDLCPTRLGGSGWYPAYYCRCLCRYADQGLPAPQRRAARP